MALELTIDRCANMAYLCLPGHPGRGSPGCVANSQMEHELLPRWQGPDMVFDFNRDGELIGLEFFSADVALKADQAKKSAYFQTCFGGAHVVRTQRLSEVIAHYKGPAISLDFGDQDQLLGIAISSSD